MSSATLNASFLGSFQAMLADGPFIRFTTSKARALLAYLMVEAEYAHERATLSGLLWPEMNEKVALRNLSQCLVRVRQAIQDEQATPPFLLASRHKIQFNPKSSYQLDVTKFMQLIASDGYSESIPHVTNEQDAERLELAVALYQGSFLQGFSVSGCEAFEEWLLIKREHLQSLASDAMHELAIFHLRANNYEKAQRYAQRQLTLDAWKESAYRLLMEALALDGQRSVALAQYEKCERILEEELDVPPEDETTQLYFRIKSGELDGLVSAGQSEEEQFIEVRSTKQVAPPSPAAVPDPQAGERHRYTAPTTAAGADVIGSQLSAASSQIRVILIDDHPLFRMGVRTLLEQQDDIEVVGEADTGGAGITQIETLNPDPLKQDVVVLDCQLPDMEGPDIAAHINACGLPVRMLALSAYSEPNYIRNLLAAGVTGYVLKYEAPDTIVAAVRAAAEGRAHFSPSVTSLLGTLLSSETT